jgi:hypothetical protein
MEILMKTKSISHALFCHSVAAILAGPLLSPVVAWSADVYWIDGSGQWDTSTSWSPVGQPQNGDNVFLTQSDATNRTVNYYNTLYPAAVLNFLTIDATGTGTMTLSQDLYAHPLNSFVEYVGLNGSGAHTQSMGTNTIQNQLYLGYNPGSVGTYNLSNSGSLSVGGKEYVGYSGTGTFNQSGGTNTVTSDNELILGFSSGSSGTYNLSNTGSVTMETEFIGYSGTGTFNQSGGIHTVNNTLFVAGPGGIGTYNLSNTGSLSPGVLDIGSSTGIGTFNQSGGVNTAFKVQLAPTGTYNLSAGSLTVSNPDRLMGTFNQTGGTHTCDNCDEFAVFGTYNLSNTGNLIVDNYESDIFGTFNQSGGTHTVTNTLAIAPYPGSSGNYNLSGGKLTVVDLVNNGNFNLSSSGSLSATGSEHVGDFSQYASNSGTGIFNQSGGTNTIQNFLYLGYNLGSVGTYNLSDSANLTANNESIGVSGTGNFNQSGGTHTVSNSLILGSSSGGSGTYNLSGGTLSLTGDGTEYLGSAGTGVFNQSGGTHTINLSLVLGSQGGSGTYNLSSGSLSVGLDLGIGNFATGTFHQSGGTVAVDRALSLGNSGTGIYNLSAGSLSVSYADRLYGTFNQSGGTHTCNNCDEFLVSGTYNLSNTGNLIVDTYESDILGTFNQSGGTHTVTNTLAIAPNSGSSGSYNLSGGMLTVGNLINNGNFNYSGGSLNTSLTNNGTTALTGTGTRTVNGTVVNNGTFTVSHTNATFTGTFTNNGKYATDPSVSTFTDLILGSNGYLTATSGDQFIIGGRLESHSAQNALWNTNNALLTFTGAGQHDLYLTGADLGATLGGYSNNFAWGEFSLGSSVGIKIWDGNTNPGAALYTGLFELDGGLSQLSTIYSDYNIYYDQSLAGNAYLGGQTYALNGAGFLEPVSSVPLPAAFWLFGSGLIGLLGFAKSKTRGRSAINACSSN